jgi:hypothetical protein
VLSPGAEAAQVPFEHHFLRLETVGYD